MRVGIDEIVKSKKLGMPTVHINTLLNTANKINHIISFRSVTPLAQSYLANGNPTKSCNIKNKSCQFGPMAGLIPIDSLYSRAKYKAQHKLYSQQIAEAKLNDLSLIEKQLILTKARIEELKNLQLDMSITYDDEHHSYLFSWQKNQNTLRAYGYWCEQSHGYLITNDAKKPILVLGRIINNVFLPITVDYDLFVIGFKRNEWDKKLDQHHHHINALPTCERSEKIIKLINQDIYDNDPARKEAIAPIVHHDQEAHNIMSSETNANFPCLFILPESVCGQLRVEDQLVNLADKYNKVLLIENMSELHSLYQLLTNLENDFYLPTHPKYSPGS